MRLFHRRTPAWLKVIEIALELAKEHERQTVVYKSGASTVTAQIRKTDNEEEAEATVISSKIK
jgi:hypothetical protein